MRFVFAKGFAEAMQFTNLIMFFNNIVPIFGWPRLVSCDNGTYFIGEDIRDTFAAFKVTMITAPIFYLLSVGLSKRYVQLIVGFLQRHCIPSGSVEE